MKKIGLMVVALVIIVACSSCNLNKSCPAYSDSSVETEQNG